MTLARALLGAGLSAMLAASATGCLAQNMLHQEVAIEEHPYEFEGQKLSYFEGTATEEKGGDLKQRQPGYLKRPSHSSSRAMAVTARATTRQLGTASSCAFRAATCSCDRRDSSTSPATRTPGRPTASTRGVDEVGVIVTALKKDHPGQPIVLIGHSAGAHVAALYTEKHPERSPPSSIWQVASTICPK